MLRRKILYRVLITICITLPGTICAQQRDDITGNWKVNKVELSTSATKEEKQKLTELSLLFLKTTFQFKADSSFLLISPEKELNQQGIWIFNSEKKNIIVWENELKGSRGKLMEILIKKSDNSYTFVLEETPIILFVSKITITKAK